jgi:purine nucleosidase
VDDVIALAVAHALADLGEVSIAAVVHDAAHPKGVEAIAAINNFYGREVPLGRYTGPLGDPEDCASVPSWVNRCRGWYVDDIVQNFPVPDLHGTVPDAVHTYRATLAAATDHSITIAEIGFLSNLQLLLQSEGDQLSPLSGIDLVARKVKRMYLMGGRHLNNRRASVEWNLAGCSASDASGLPNHRCDGGYSDIAPMSKEVIETWPSRVPIVFVGYEDGDWIRTGNILRDGHDFLWSPVRRSIRWFCTVMHFWCNFGGRSSWDPVTVLIAVRDHAYNGHRYWKEEGRLSIDEGGRTTWTREQRSTSNHSFFVVERNPEAAQYPSDGWGHATFGRRRFLEQEIDRLLVRAPAHPASYRLHPRAKESNEVKTQQARAGSWGGKCMCPDGQIYEVGDRNNFCRSLSCFGGTAGNCNHREGPWSHRNVTCVVPHT